MPDYALLLAHDEHPDPTTSWPAQPGGPCEAWAEWFESTPLLFSVLLGDARQLPELVPCSAYQDKESLISLAAPMDQVKARWQWLKTQIGPLPAHWTDSVRKSWLQIDTIISQSQRHWLLLDCATLIPHDFDTPEYAVALGALRERCLQWDCSADNLPESLQILKQHPQDQLGWWSHSVLARTEVIERDNDDDWPAWLKDDYVERYHSAWDENVEAYYVIPRKHPRTGEKLPGENHRDNWPVGLVTPYGRWLVKPIEGANGAYTSGGFITVHYPEAREGDGERSGLKDLNGNWVVPPSAGYLNAYALTPQVMACKSANVPGTEDLRSLPGLELLHEGLSSIYYNADEDEFIRADQGPYGESRKLLLKSDGKPLFDASKYEHINDFNTKTGLAVACIRQRFINEQGEEVSHIREGVIHISGQEVIPCEYKTIERGFNSSPPKLLPGGKLLAITEKGQPHVYSSKGKLLASPHIWCPPLNCSPKKNELLTFMGEGPGAELVMFSIKDFSITRTGETWDDYLNAMRGMFKGLDGEQAETTTMTREELIKAEDETWMQDLTRILCLGEEKEASELLQQWRDCVADPDPADMGWEDGEDEDNEIDPDVMHLPEGENALTLYWVHLIPIATQFARFDWKDAEGIADTHWLPGTDNWHWDTPADDVESGLEHLAEHLDSRDMALIRLATDDDSIRITVVRAEDAEDFLDRLAQASISATNYSSS
ncbi:MAG: WG repeat-containing protein [Comamonas sp.]|jgi:hypothetical protein|uniref:DUF6630 family protein n=1 Tax=Comamonas sp. TaxID=34028 RepID=UPI002830E39B|nr:WG repeat-containing protein [Comamonas sp.]MDR0216100.1 WG repeat-containing protein [Comamonas sp.]